MTTNERSATSLLKRILRADLLGGETTALAPTAAEWPGVMAAAQAEGFAPLLYAALRRLHLIDAAPASIGAALRAAYARSLRRTGGQMMALRGLLERLAADGVRVVVLKGPALGTLLYRDPAVRPMIDIDLLVPATSLPQATAALHELEYVASAPFQGFEFAQSEEGELGFVKRTPPAAVVDLHWHVFTVPGYAASVLTEWFWEQTTSATIADCPVLVFDHEALLLHLSVHNYVHHTDRSLRRLLDVALLLHRHGDEMDAEILWRGACAIGMGHVLERMLRDVQDEWEVSTAALAERLQRVGVAAPAKAPTGADIDALRSPLRHLAIGMSMADARRGVRYVVREMFPHTHYLRTRYGMRRDWHAPYYYALRIGRGVTQVVRWLLKSRES